MNRSRSVLTASALLAVFFGAGQAAVAQTSSCDVAYSVVSQWSNGFQGDVKITNNGSAVAGWTLIWTFPSGQTITQLWNGASTQSGAAVTVNNAAFNADLGTGASADVGFTASITGANTAPAGFTLNGVSCSVNGAAAGGGGTGGGGTGGGGTGGGGGSGGGAAQADGIPVPSTVSLTGVANGPLTILNWGGFKAATSWTFDDSQPSQIEHFNDIKAVGVPVTYYIVTGLANSLANYNSTWSAAVSAGFEIGNHTQDHCHQDLTGCITTPSTGALTSEIDNDTNFITSHYGQKAVWTGASPYGDTGYDSPASSRFLVYRGVAGGSIRPNDNTDPFNLPCHLAAQGETAAQFNAVTDAARSAGSWQIYLIHTISPTNNVWFNPVAVTDVTGAMTHAKTAGDTWVDSVVNVAAYWRGLKVLATANRSTSGTSTTWSWTLPAHFPTGKFLRVTVPSGTLSQKGVAITKNSKGFFSVSLDAGSLTLTQ